MKKIIVPVDFSETSQNALRYAILFAQDHAANLEVINVVPPDYQPIDGMVMTTPLTNILRESAEKRNISLVESTITQIQTTHQLQDLPTIVPRVEIDPPIAVVSDIVTAEDFDLIILGTQGEHSALDRILGSVSSGLVQKATKPILVVPEHASYKPIKKVCVAVDLKESDPWQIHKASELLMPGIEHMDIIHIYPNEKAKATEIDLQDLKQYFTQNNRGIEMNYHTELSPHLSETLLDYVNKSNADLLIMLGPHLHGIKKWFLQSNAKKMTYQSNVPFLRIN